MDWVNALARSPEVWAALLAFFNVAILISMPTFNKELLVAFNGLFVAVFAVIAGKTTPPAVRSIRETRSLKK